MNHITKESKIEWLIVANIERSRIASASLKFAVVNPSDLRQSLVRKHLFSESVHAYRLASHVLHEVKHG